MDSLQDLRDVVRVVDEAFGEGFSKKNPSLVGMFLLSWEVRGLGKEIGRLGRGDAVEEGAIDILAESLRGAGAKIADAINTFPAPQ